MTESAGRSLARTGIAGLLTLAAIVPIGGAQRDANRVYAVVTEGGGKPIKGLAAKDFTVKVDGAPRNIVSAAPATDPVSVEILTDRFGDDATYGILGVRATFSVIVQALHKGDPDGLISFRTFDGASILQVKPTNSVVELASVIKRLLSAGTTPVLLEAVHDACLSLESAPSDRRVILAVIAGYKIDWSAGHARDVANDIFRTGASFWVLEGLSSQLPPIEGPERQILINQVAPASGGVHDVVRVGTALETRGRWMADLILSQYAVDYDGPRSGAKLEVGVTVPKAKVIAPTWVR